MSDLIPEGGKSIKDRVSGVLETVKDIVDAFGIVQADAALLGRVGWYLQEKPNMWHLVPSFNEFHDLVLDDIQSFLDRQIEEPLIFICMTHRWVLIREKTHLLPILFINKGGHTSFFRIIAGKNAGWLRTFDDLLGTIAVRSRPEAELPPAEVIRPLKRDEKWEIGGFIR